MPLSQSRLASTVAPGAWEQNDLRPVNRNPPSTATAVVVGETHASDHCHVEGGDQNIHGAHLRAEAQPGDASGTLHLPGGNVR